MVCHKPLIAYSCGGSSISGPQQGLHAAGFPRARSWPCAFLSEPKRGQCNTGPGTTRLPTHSPIAPGRQATVQAMPADLATTITIAPADHLDAPALQFLLDARAALFAGRMDLSLLPADLGDFAVHYGAAAGGPGRLFLARHAQLGIVGSIACRTYDHRFPQLDPLGYRGLSVVEVMRLFVAPALRRTGLARALVRTLVDHAQAQGVQRLYLHTHPFLPGALAFWQAMGCALRHQDGDPVWQTLHLDCAPADCRA